jgi:hypothetical protein
MTITAKYRGTCTSCGASIQPGQSIEWTKGQGSQHTTCPAAPVGPFIRPVHAHSAAPTKRCWECGISFSRSQMGEDGDWSESYCGC